MKAFSRSCHDIWRYPRHRVWNCFSCWQLQHIEIFVQHASILICVDHLFKLCHLWNGQQLEFVDKETRIFCTRPWNSRWMDLSTATKSYNRTVITNTQIEFQCHVMHKQQGRFLVVILFQESSLTCSAWKNQTDCSIVPHVLVVRHAPKMGFVVLQIFDKSVNKFWDHGVYSQKR